MATSTTSSTAATGTAASDTAGPGIHTLKALTGWQNQQNGIVLSRHKQKSKAVATGRRLAKRLATELTVHGRNGTVLRTASYATPTSPTAQ